MSLLMDALKRAEKARQAQAARQAEDKGSPTPELSLDPLDADKAEADRTPSSSPEVEPPAKSDSQATTRFRLSDDDDFPATERLEPAPPRQDEPGEKLGPFSLQRDDELSMEDTGEMIPAVSEAEQALNQYFDEAAHADTVPGEAPTEDADSARSDRRSAQSDSKRTASRVFEAKEPALARQRRSRALAMMAVPLLLLGIVGAGAAGMWDDVVRVFIGPPAILPERPPQTAAAPEPEPRAAPAPESNRVEAAVRTAGGTPAASAQAGSSAPAGAGPSAAAGTAEPTGTAAAAESRAAGASRMAGAQSGGGTAAAARPSPESASDPQPLASAAPMQSAALTRQALAARGGPLLDGSAAGIRISSKSKPDRVHPLLLDAYQAYQGGDDRRARALYSHALEHEPRSRNAMLGLAALAVRAGDNQEAMRLYARLLSLNPRDPVARAALIDLNRSVPADQGESHVKRLLRDSPDQAFLHFTLGNLYSRQGRWAAAQKAFFDAYRRDSSNGDYAFNLAVSLDHLGQGPTALTYYRRALELASGAPVNFRAEAAQIRIAALSGESG